MKFYKRDPDRALAGMVELTLQERGAYNTILDLLYSRDGCLKDDDEAVRRAMGCHGNEWRAVKSKLIAKGKIWIDGGFLRANGVDEVVEQAADFSETQRKRVEKRWEKAGKRLGKAPEILEKRNDINGASIPYTPIYRTEANASGADAPNLSEILFGPALQYLTRNGVTEKHGRALIGKWRKEHGEEATLAALRKSQAEGASEPVAFITGVLSKQSKPRRRADDQFARIIDMAAGSAGCAEGDEAMDSNTGAGASAPRLPGGDERSRGSDDVGGLDRQPVRLTAGGN